MGKKCISVSDCKSGDIIAQKIVSNYGATIVVENTIVNNYIKNKLALFEIKYIWIYDSSVREPLITAKNAFLQVRRDYKQNVLDMETIVNDIVRGKDVNVNKINKVSNSMYNSIDNEYYIVKCLNKLKTTDKCSYVHSVNVSFYAMLIAKWLCFSKTQIKEVVQAGLLHDVGKAKVPNDILNKKGKLNLDEIEEIKKHPIYGYNIVKNVNNISCRVKQAIIEHHERENKSGYPLGKSGDDIDIYSKIIAVADVYDGITSDRVYRKKATPFEAFEIIKKDDIGCFDIHIVDTFLENLAACYVGSKVVLNDGKTAEIIYVPPHDITKPVISIENRYIDTSKENELKIVSML